MIPYAHIRATADRRWTGRLLERLTCAELPEEERADLVEALGHVSDPRSFAPLEALLCDAAQPERLRTAAGDVLRGLWFFDFDPPPGKLRRWWAEGDALLRRHALLWMDGLCCPDVILQVAADPMHPWQADALGKMTFWFDRPEHEAIKIAALSHSDAAVRATAADVLLWDEPVHAEGPLLRATRDPVAAVAANAANTLQYYPSRRTLRCLHGLLGHPHEQVREEAADSFNEVRGEMLNRLCRADPAVAGRLRAWLRPVWELLAFREEELQPDEEESPPARSPQSKETLPVADLLALLADPDASPRVLQEKLGDNAWEAYGPAERSRLRPLLLGHADPLVRNQATACLAAWQDVAGLMALADDRSFGVRKSALYHLGRLPPAPGVAELAWDHLQRADALGCHATETLTTFARQASPEIAVPRLAGLAADAGQRECVRVAAVEELVRLQADEPLARLLPLLREPPAVTWALHLALLRAVEELELPTPEIGHLGAVDNLHVQEAVAGHEAV
jgi:HEAT repeat protein